MPFFRRMRYFETHTRCSWSGDRQIDRSLRIAVCGGDLRKVVRLVVLGADVNLGGAFSPLLAAVSRAPIDIIRFLLRHGANPNISHRGIFPIHVATANGRCAVVQMLLEYGAFPDARKWDGTTPLILAAQIGNVDIAQLLMTYGARVQVQRTSDGFTALHVICGRKRQSSISSAVLAERSVLEDSSLLIASVIIEYVIMYDGPKAAGTLIEQKSYAGKTALSLALENQHVTIADLLVQHNDSGRPKKTVRRPRNKRPTQKKVSAQSSLMSTDRSVSSRHALIGNHTKSMNGIKRQKSQLKEAMQVFQCWRVSS